MTGNPKRKFQDPPLDDDARGELAAKIDYRGSPYHKRNPGDFGLTPPSQPHPDKTLCDGADILSRARAEQLLKLGVERGLTSQQWKGEFPRNIWAVADGIPLEAQLENHTQGHYHGYPLQEEDPWRTAVLERWSEDE